jgi:hypothetical protein
VYPKSQLSVILFDILGLTVKVVNLNFEDAVQAEVVRLFLLSPMKPGRMVASGPLFA